MTPLKEIEEHNRRMKLGEGIALLDRYPGSLDDYNKLKEQEHVQLDTGRTEKYVFVDGHREWDLLEKLISLGCVAFVWYVPPMPDAYDHKTGGYGIPVKRK